MLHQALTGGSPCWADGNRREDDDLAAYMEAHGIPTEMMVEQGRRRVVWDDADEAAAAAFDAFMDANAADGGDASCTG